MTDDERKACLQLEQRGVECVRQIAESLRACCPTRATLLCVRNRLLLETLAQFPGMNDEDVEVAGFRRALRLADDEKRAMP